MSSHDPKPSPHSEAELLEQWDFLDAMVERQAAALRAGIQDVEEDEAVAAVSELQQLRQQLDHVRAQLTDAERRRAESAAALSRQQREHAALRRAHQILDTAHAGALADKAALGQHLASYVAANDDAKARGGAAEREIVELRSRLRSAQDDRDEAETQRVAALAAAEQLRSRLSAVAQPRAPSAASLSAEAERRRWRERAAALEAELEVLRQRSAAESAALQDRLQQAEAALSRWQSSHAELVAALHSAHREVEALQAKRTAQAGRHHFWSRRR